MIRRRLAGFVAVALLAWCALAQVARAEVDNRLREIMRNIHRQCIHWGEGPEGDVDYVRGANVAGFVKVADAMLSYGHV